MLPLLMYAHHCLQVRHLPLLLTLAAFVLCLCQTAQREQN
jgi:hypothetical protein